MQRQRNGLLPIGEAFSGLDGPVKAIREASPHARRIRSWSRIRQP